MKVNIRIRQTVVLFGFLLALTGITAGRADRAFGAEELFYRSVEAPEEDIFSLQSEVPTASGVSEEMCSYPYWLDKNSASKIETDTILISKSEIAGFNREMLLAEGAEMHDIEALSETYDPDKIRKSLAKACFDPSKGSGATAFPDKSNFSVNTVTVSQNDYCKNIGQEILDSAYTGTTSENRYAVAVHRTPLLVVPTKDYIGYSPTDTDDENVNSALNVNEPFVIRQKATVSGNDFYWGYTFNCTGWVSAEDLAVCRDKHEWTDAWKTDPESSDFIVVTLNKIVLEPSYYDKELSEVKLTFGTVLKKVPEDEIPDNVGERGPWNNYSVYLPTRDKDGNYVKQVAFISQHYELSEGYPDMTQEEILRLAFNNLGDRYGWGGMLDSMDCSLFTRNVYRCFGLELPRNTSWQLNIPGRKIDLSGLKDEEKLSVIKKMPAGTLFFFPGHTMIYLGTSDNMAYVISDTGSLSDSGGELNVRSMYSVIINPLTARRRTGNTWLTEITAAVLPVSEENFGFVKENIESGENEIEPSESEIKKVPVISGQTYGASADTLALDTFTKNIKSLFISFSNVEGSGVNELSVTCLKGSKITVREAVESVDCDKKTAKVKTNRESGTATVTVKSSGTVNFRLSDGKEYAVSFSVEKPKAVKTKIPLGNETVIKTVKDLFNTELNSGELSVIPKKNASGASVSGNQLIISPTGKDTLKVQYKYLNKKYKTSIRVG